MSRSGKDHPILRLSISAENPADDTRLASALTEIAAQNPAIVIHPHSMTAFHPVEAWTKRDLESICDRLCDEYHLAINTGLLEAVLVETICKPAEAEGKYIRQTGGQGNYGHCKLHIEPSERGTGYEFTNKLAGGAIPGKYIQPINEGVQAAMKMGVLAGHPMVDVKVTLFGGSYHEMDSNEMAFRFAASTAFKEAAKIANPVVLEPMMSVEVAAFEDMLTMVRDEIHAHRGRVAHTESISGLTEITAIIPLSELLATTAFSELPMEFVGHEPVRDRGSSDEDGPGVTAKKPNRPGPGYLSEAARNPPED